MGVINLWTELVKYDNVYRTWSGSGATGGDTRGIVAELSGKVLAIDTSVWIFQCSQQSDLKEAIFDEHARVLYTFHNRILSLLRYGATPVFVLEGDTPEAKRGRLNQRSLARGLGGCAVGNRRGGRHDALGRKVVELLDLLGVPHVDAPGEAEALCAALVSAGLAGGAVTSDVDALLFGADTVYRECRLSMDAPKLNVLERADGREAARRAFGLLGGGSCTQALRAVACLCGCDYSVSGGRGVGVKTALEAVQQLTAGQQDDSHVLSALLRCLAEGPDPRVTALKACTGCKNCGHEKHGRKPCEVCGPGPCRPKGEGAPCLCEFHRSEPQRKFMRVIARAVGTGAAFSDTCRAALEAFDSETQRARAAAEALRRRIGAFSWSSRPDVRGVFSLLHPLLGRTSADPDKLLWTYGEVRDKLRPLLIEWDLRQGPQPTAAVRAQVEFRPRRIKQVASKDGEEWAYLVEFERLPDVNPADSAFDTAQLVNSKLSKGRHVRQSLIRDAWPQLLQLKEEEEQAKLEKPKKGRGKGAATASQSPGATASPSSAAAGGGSRGRSRARPAATVLSTDASAGSRDVMMRFLHMGTGTPCGAAGAATGAAAPSASVQQQSPTPQLRAQQQQQQAYQRQPIAEYNPYLREQPHAADSGSAAAGTAGAGLLGGPAVRRPGPGSGGFNPYLREQPAAQEHAAPGAGPADDEDEYGDGMDLNMTQRNDASAAWQVGGGGSAAGAAAAGPSGGGGGAGARAWQSLWPDDSENGNERSSGGLSAGDDGAFARGTSAAGDSAAAAQGAAGMFGATRRHNRDHQYGAEEGQEDDARPMSLNQRLEVARRQGLTQRAAAATAGGSGGRAAGGGGAAACDNGGEDDDVEVFDLTQLADTPVPPPRAAQRRCGSGGHGEGSGQRLQYGEAEVGTRAAEEEEEEEEQQEGDALGSAVKPPVRARAFAGADAGCSGGGCALGQGGAGGSGAAAQPSGSAMPGGGEAEAAAATAVAGARRARLLRSLFPDREPPSPLLGTPQVRKKVRDEAAVAAQESAGPSDACAGEVPPGPGASAGQQQQQQQRQQEERRPDLGAEGSPSKRQHTGDTIIGPGSGARLAGGDATVATASAAAATVAVGAAAAAAAAAGAGRAAEAVDLTLTDSDDDADMGGGGPSRAGGGTAGLRTLAPGHRQGQAMGQRGVGVHVGAPPALAAGGQGGQPQGPPALRAAARAVQEQDEDDDDVVILS